MAADSSTTHSSAKPPPLHSTAATCTASQTRHQATASASNSRINRILLPPPMKPSKGPRDISTAQDDSNACN